MEQPSTILYCNLLSLFSTLKDVKNQRFHPICYDSCEILQYSAVVT